MKNYSIIVPALSNEGPIKGAIALANILKAEHAVDFVVLKKCTNVPIPLPIGVKLVDLSDLPLRKKINFMGNHIYDISFSSCFSADLFCLLFVKAKKKVTSVRANNFKNYKLDYGLKGLFLAFLHSFIFNFFDQIVVINKSLSYQLSKFVLSKRKISIIGNFIDEDVLFNFKGKHKIESSNVKNKPVMLFFMGNLIERKKVDIVLDAIKDIDDVVFHIIGDGPLREQLTEKMVDLDISDKVFFHGKLDNPYSLLLTMDIFILPSLSEGVSRAMLESLYFCKPCLVRDVDSNSEVINESNGICFTSDDDLKDNLIDIITRYKTGFYSYDKPLIPYEFSLNNAKDKYTKLLDEI